jgi:hypothetical protein
MESRGREFPVARLLPNGIRLLASHSWLLQFNFTLSSFPFTLSRDSGPTAIPVPFRIKILIFT